VDVLIRWSENFFHDPLTGGWLPDVLITRGRLNDESTIDYAWGISNHTYRGLSVISHGGSFPGSFRFLMSTWPLRGCPTARARMSTLCSFEWRMFTSSQRWGRPKLRNRPSPGVGVRRAVFILLILAISLSTACAELGLTRRDERNRGRLAGERAGLEGRMRETFGVPGRRTPWYDNIEDVRVVGATAQLRTNIKPNAEGENFALPICGAVLDISPRRIRRVVVYGQGAVLDRCS
jgi:hypothetical protein